MNSQKKIRFISITFFAVICLVFACKSRKMTEGSGGKEGSELTERCSLKYDPGPCRGAFTRYYYDAEKGKCMSFIYGGCQGVVPFETLEDCQAACGRQ